MVYAKFGGQTECIMGNWKIENWQDICINKKRNGMIIPVGKVQELKHIFVKQKDFCF